MELPVNYTQISSHKRRAVRQEYAVRQSGLCYHCKAPLSGPPNDKRTVRKELFPQFFFNYPQHLHHCHKTGMTIGTVHAHCNAVLWQYYRE